MCVCVCVCVGGGGGLHERHLLAKSQLKETFFLQRSQMLNRQKVGRGGYVCLCVCVCVCVCAGVGGVFLCV